MMDKRCRDCVYNDGIRNDGTYTYKCCTPERQRNYSITDCCVPEEPLRKLQHEAVSTEQFFDVTAKYIKTVKAQSKYWSSL